MFCPNIGTEFREPYHLNHVIPRLEIDLIHVCTVNIYIVWNAITVSVSCMYDDLLAFCFDSFICIIEKIKIFVKCSIVD